MEFDPQGEISCIRDLRESRELLKKGAVGNELIVYEDRPMEFDAWNIDAGYREKKWKFGGVTGVLPGRKRACERSAFDPPSFSGFCFRAEDLFLFPYRQDRF